MECLSNEIKKEAIKVLKYMFANSLAANENKTAILIIRRGNTQPNTHPNYASPNANPNFNLIYLILISFN